MTDETFSLIIIIIIAIGIFALAAIPLWTIRNDDKEVGD